MKPSDTDLIEKLNALPDEDRADLLEFLGHSHANGAERASLKGRLEASVEVHRNLLSDTKH